MVHSQLISLCPSLSKYTQKEPDQHSTRSAGTQALLQVQTVIDAQLKINQTNMQSIFSENDLVVIRSVYPFFDRHTC